MSVKSILLYGCLLGSLQARCQVPADSAQIAHAIIHLEQALADALPGDSSTWSKYLDPQWHIVDEDGAVSARSEFLAAFKPFPKEVSGQIQVTRPIFSFHGNTVVIHYVADEYESFYGQKLHTTYGTMDVWYKTDTSWMLLSMQDFEIPAWPPAITLSANTLQKYTGTYRLTDSLTAVVSLQNDTLFLQKRNHKKEALFPETPTVFFHKSEARGRKVFVTDDKGIMLMRERRNGQDVVWKRN